MKPTKAILLLSVVLTLLLAFQNCRPTSITDFAASNVTTKTGGGNGEPYDGKPTYARFVPGWTCANQSAAMGSLEINGDTARVVRTENACANTAEIVPVKDLETSTFTNRFVGFGGGVYTFLQNPAETAAKGIFTEAWCRVMSKDRARSIYEFAVEWQENGQIAQFSYFDDSVPAGTSDQSVRSLDIDRVSYARSNGDILRIYLNQKLPGSQKIAGSYIPASKNSSEPLSTECLMGGQFDPVAPQFTYAGSAHRTTVVGKKIEGFIPIVNKSTVHFMIDGALPGGVEFNSANGAITGAPLSLMARKNYVVSAVFPFGQVSRQISLAVGKVQVVDREGSSGNSIICKNPEGACDLSGAIGLAKQIAPLPLIVQVNTPLISLAGKSFEIQGDLSIEGIQTEATTLDAKDLTRHFELSENAHLELRHLRLVNGSGLPGGSVFAKSAQLIVQDCTFENNRSGDVNSGGQGGAIYATRSSVEIEGSVFQNNHAFLNGSLVGGGAIFLDAVKTASIKGSTFLRNSGQNGGAIHLDGASNAILEITNTLFDSNSAMFGGGIFTQFNEVSIQKSQFYNNEAVFHGGAISFNSATRAWLADSLLEGNSGQGTHSPGVYWQGRTWANDQFLSSTLYILETKMSNQSTKTPSSGVILNYAGQVVLRGNTLQKNNGVPNCRSIFENAVSNFVSLGGNYSDDNTCPR